MNFGLFWEDWVIGLGEVCVVFDSTGHGELKMDVAWKKVYIYIYILR